MKKNSFLLRNKEEASLNQYWYSAHTIDVLVDEIQQLHKKLKNSEEFQNSTKIPRIAFLATPSLFFSLTDESVIDDSVLFDLDENFGKKLEREKQRKKITTPEKGGSFVKYDFNEYNTLPEDLSSTFSIVVIDPPFITKEVWEKFAATTQRLCTKDEKNNNSPKYFFIGTTIEENHELLKNLFPDCGPVLKHVFRPSIPKLVYQYCVYTNYPAATSAFNDKNEEIEK